MTSSNGNIFRVTGHLCGEFTGAGKFPAQRPVTRSFDAIFDLRWNKRPRKQWWGWWFETPSSPLWRHPNVYMLCSMGELTVCISFTVCHDRDPECPGWAEVGECENNPGYMLAFCHKSCGICGGGKFKIHDDVIKWKHFPRYSDFVRGIHRWPVVSPNEGQWRRALMLSLICAWSNGWANNRNAGDLRRHRARYDVIVMI